MAIGHACELVQRLLQMGCSCMQQQTMKTNTPTTFEDVATTRLSPAYQGEGTLTVRKSWISRIDNCAATKSSKFSQVAPTVGISYRSLAFQLCGIYTRGYPNEQSASVDPSGRRLGKFTFRLSPSILRHATYADLSPSCSLSGHYSALSVFCLLRLCIHPRLIHPHYLSPPID